MRRIFLIFVLPFNLFAQGVPYLSGRVNDYAGLLSPQTRAELESLLKSHEDSTSNQVVVLTIRSLEGEVLEDYSMKVAQTWKLGQKEKNNGVVLLVAKDDRKVRIEVGYGLEATLTDARCSQIIRNEIVPRFKDGDFDGGVRSGVEAILGTIAGSYEPEEADSGSGKMDFGGMLFFVGIFLAVVGTHSVFAILNRGFASWFHGAFLVPFWLLFPYSVFGGVVGILPVIFYIILFVSAKMWFASSTAGAAFQSRLIPKSGRGFFGSSGGGGWSSGGGGGFSGGGGSFGGGGSSGSW